ncbi:MAG: PAS domain S-box protein [Proteobacteria bacterium]|nr:PAS domain S-box protein [Pseudomonadota bacterium]
MNTNENHSGNASNDKADFENPRQDIYLILARLFDIMFPIILSLGGIALAASLYRSVVQHGWYPAFLFHIAVYLSAVGTFILRRRIPVLLVFLLISLFVYAVALQSLYTLGLAGTGVVHLVILCTFAGIFLGVKVGMIALGASILTVILVGSGIYTGAITTRPDTAAYLLAPANWILQVACFLMYVAPLVLSLNGLQKKIVNSFHEMKANNLLLEKEISIRRQAEEELRKSEEKYRSIFDNSTMGIFQSTPEGTLLNANSAHARMHGFYSVEEFMASITDIKKQLYVDSEDRDRFMEILNAQGSIEGFQAQQYRKDGKKMWISINARAVTDANGTLLCYEGTAKDITERKQAAEALRESESKFRDLSEKSIAGIYLVQDNLFKYVNSRFAEIHGYGIDEMIDKVGPKDVILPDDLPVMDENLRKRISGEVKSLHFEFRIRTKNREIKYVEVYGSRTMYRGQPAVIGTLLDITKHKRAEQALLESEAKYRSVVESALVGFYIIQGGTFRYVNQRFCDMTGYTYDEIIDTLPYMDIIHPDDKTKVAENVGKRMNGEDVSIEYDLRVVRKSGQVVMVRVFGGSMQYNGSKAISGTFVDITHERVLESQLRQAQKVEAIGQLAGGIAHDFNNILTVLTGYGSLLQMKMDKNNPLRIYVDQMLSASQKASSLTQSLLTFSRQQPITLRPVNINTVIGGTEKLLKRLLTEDIALKVSLTPDAITIMADATQVDQILFNLATNARDAMKKGGVLSVETKRIILDHEFRQAHGFGEPGQYALLSVSDTGMGMDETTREKIFDPFFTTKEVGKGTGLGLSTVYGIVKQHGGYINVYSELNVGTVFRIYLPAIREEAAEEQAPPCDFRTGEETILIAEDNENVRQFVVEIFSLCGYKMIEAVDGADAIQRFQENKEINLVILDSVMPGKNGRETYDEIVKIKPDIKVIFISGYTRDIILDKGIQTKDFAFVQKPLSPGELLQKAREVLDS